MFVATRSLAGLMGRRDRGDNVGKHRCVVACPTLALRLVEVLFHLRLVQVPAGCRSEPGRDLLLGWFLSGFQVLDGYPDALVAYVVRVLGDEPVHVALSEVFDLGRRGIEGYDAHLVLFARLPDSRSGALSGEDVGAENTFQVRVGAESRGGDRCRLYGIVVAVLGPKVLDVRVLFYRLFEALLPLIGSGDARGDADDHNLALFADLLSQAVSSDHASLYVVGGDLGQRDLFLLDGRVHEHYGYVLIDGALYRGDHGGHVGGRDEDCVRVGLDGRVQNRRLLGGGERIGSLHVQFGT